MTNYTDKALQSSQNRRTILNSSDTNTVNSIHTFKATTQMGGLQVLDSLHKDGSSDSNAGKISATRGNGAIALDGQEISVSRSGGTSWNRLTLRGADPTGSVIQFNQGINTQIGESGVEGFRLGFSGVSNHTGSVASGGLGIERVDSFFLQSGNGSTVTNILDVSITDGEVYFYKGLRNSDTTGLIQLSGYTVNLQNKSSSLSNNDSISQLNFKGDNDGSTTKTFASLTAKAKSVSEDMESGQIDLNVLGSAGSLVALSVYAVGSSDAVVKISDTWTLPSSGGSSGQVLTTNGTSSSWTTLPAESDTLGTVVARGATTSASLTTGSVIPFSSTSTLGSSSSNWQDLHLSSGGKVYFGANDVVLESNAGTGLTLDMTGESNGEPVLRIKSNTSSNTTGPTLNLLTDATVSNSEIVSRVMFSGQDAGGSESSYGVIEGVVIDSTTSAWDGSIKHKVPVNGSLGIGLEVYSNQTNRIVKISDAWTLPHSSGSAGQLLTADANGDAVWSDAPAQLDLSSESVGELSDVTVSNPQQAQVLRYSNSSSAFINAQLSYNDLSSLPTLGTSASKNAGTNADEVLLISTDTTLPALDGSALTALPSVQKLSDVGTQTPTDGQVLAYNASSSQYEPTTTATYSDNQARNSAGSALESGSHSGLTSITFTNDNTNNRIDLTVQAKSTDLTDVSTDTPTNNQVLRYTTDSGLNKYAPTTLGSSVDYNVGTTSGRIPTISDHYISSGSSNETGDLIIFGRVIETIDYGFVSDTFSPTSHFAIDYGSVTDTVLYASEDYGVLVV